MVSAIKILLGIYMFWNLFWVLVKIGYFIYFGLKCKTEKQFKLVVNDVLLIKSEVYFKFIVSLVVYLLALHYIN